MGIVAVDVVAVVVIGVLLVSEEYINKYHNLYQCTTAVYHTHIVYNTSTKWLRDIIKLEVCITMRFKGLPKIRGP